MDLKSTRTFLMIPFHLEGVEANQTDWTSVLDTRMWLNIPMKPEKNVLFPYIQHFLQASVTGEENLQPHDYRIFSLNTTDTPCLKLLYNKPLILQAKDRSISFQLLNRDNGQTFDSTKLVISPNAGIGIFVIAAEVFGRKVALDDLMQFNYHIRKTMNQRAPLYIERMQHMSALLENNKKKLAELTDEKQKKELSDKTNQMVESIKKMDNDLEMIYRYTKHDKKEKPDAAKFWNLDDLLSLFFDSIHRECTRFNLTHCHHFTYFQADVEQSNKELEADFLRIVRGMDREYQVLENDHDSITQTFKNVYIGSSIEGSAIMTLSPKGDSCFFDQFYSSNLPRYMWIYLMIVIQRYTLMYMLKLLTEVDDGHDDTIGLSLKRLRNFVRLLNEVKVNTYFTDVSEITQHNIFYQFSSERLGVLRSFIEIDQKMHSLNESLVQLSNVRKEKYQYNLSLLVTIMAVASTSNDFLGWFKEVCPSVEKTPFYIPIGILVFAVCIIFVILILRKIRKN